jgi:DAK2 domain fusion protein YloV
VPEPHARLDAAAAPDVELPAAPDLDAAAGPEPGRPARPELDPPGLRAVVGAFADALVAHRAGINRLNVYPVPDGDTGTNMSLTLASVMAEVDQAAPVTMAELCTALAHGSLMGARGNSGVIVSQILRGFCEVVRLHDTVDAPILASALDAAAVAAYGAVMRPVEGTILTVVREMGGAATAAASRGADLREVALAARERGQEALARTPELLPVLADAGVVDAGGTGLLLLADALLHVIDGRPMPEPDPTLPAELPTVSAAAAPDVASLRYEVMFFLHATDEQVAGFKNAWMDIGDSIVVVGGNGVYNCHIHTNDIGAAIEAGVEAGRPSKIRVTDLFEEVEEQAWVRDAAGTAPAAVAEHVTTGVVAVGVGSGIERLFRSLGVHEIVTGGQSMNPSTADLLAAVDACPADGVVILPNNKNIIPVAQQVAAHTGKAVRVVPTRNVAEALAALVDYDPEADLDDNATAMQVSAEAVVAGEVTQAVRDANSPAGPVRTGDHIGIGPHGIAAVAGTVVGACTALLDALVTDDHEIVTLIAGADADPADTAEIEAWLEAERPDVAVEVHLGGQPLYTYYLGVE